MNAKKLTRLRMVSMAKRFPGIKRNGPGKQIRSRVKTAFTGTRERLNGQL